MKFTNLFERFLESIAVGSLVVAVAVVCYSIGSFVSLIARLIGCTLF